MKKIKLTDICNPKQWKTIPTSDLLEEGFPVYGANGIIGYYKEYNHENPVIAITCRGATCGSINITVPKAYVTGNAMCLDDLQQDVDFKYLYYCLLHYNFATIISGSAQPQITRQGLEKVIISIGTPEEQKKIVAVLEKLHALIAARKQQLSALDDLIKARFVEMFGDGKYKSVKASEVCDFITKGTTPPTDAIVENSKKGGVPFLKVYNLSFTGELLFDEKPQYITIETHNGALARSKVYPNDVLMNIVGPPLGKFSLVTDEFPEWNINQAIAIFRAKENILPRYLMAALMQPNLLKPFLEQAVGIRQLNLSLEQCRNLEFPLPSVAEQKGFVEFSHQVEKLKVTVKKALNKTQLLFDSLMQQYFG